MLSSRVFPVVYSLCVVIMGFSSLLGCEDAPPLPHRCGEKHPGDSCHVSLSSHAAGTSGMLEPTDGGPRDAAEPSGDMEMVSSDAGAAAFEDSFPLTPHCDAPAHFFSPACASPSFDPEAFPVPITPGCYRSCARPRDATCGFGTRCGRAGIAPLLCSGASCTAICAEVWLCLPLRYFPSSNSDTDAGPELWVDGDSGVIFDAHSRPW